MKFEITTVPVVVVVISSISVWVIASVGILSNRDTLFLQGYAIGVITLIAYIGIVSSWKK
jgi:hypothetical protein